MVDFILACACTFIGGIFGLALGFKLTNKIFKALKACIFTLAAHLQIANDYLSMPECGGVVSDIMRDQINKDINDSIELVGRMDQHEYREK